MVEPPVRKRFGRTDLVTNSVSAPRPELATGSARRVQLLDAAYAYIVDNGAASLSLRPLATAIGSSPRVLLYLFGSKDGLIQALLQHARADQMESMAGRVVLAKQPAARDIFAVARAVWEWLSTPSQRPVLALWVEAYGRALTDPDGPWSLFAQGTVDDWLTMLAEAQPTGVRQTSKAESERTAVLAVLRGGLLDLLATGDVRRTTTAVHMALDSLAGRVVPEGPQ
ncbi:TetR/AcrR family transcriptional regulator [Gordonia hongkongensis]|uniref:TetR/AcrR family transcriptional regulator n=1 Tax=Gordonia hongkongensis TaxID=1701090 RepID=UPI003D0DB1D1